MVFKFRNLEVKILYETCRYSKCCVHYFSKCCKHRCNILFSASEPVSAVLEDLKSLVPAVLEDALDSSDESQE